jgi:hypothetical protein
VDVGAGTTDVAFFWFHATDGLPEACYFGANSGFVGMDDIDKLIARTRALDLSDVRKLHAQRHWRDSNASLEHGIRARMDSIYDEYRFAFNRAYDRCRGEYEWVDRDRRRARYVLCLIGGGAAFAPLERVLQQPLPYLMMQSVEIDFPTVPSTLHVLSAGGKIRPLIESEAREGFLFLLAYGLAHRAIDIPNYDENHRFTRVTEVLERPTHEEIYAK